LEKENASLAKQKWNAQWMQKTTSEEGSIVKREWWNPWESEALPPVSYIIQSYDTACSKKETADYSAMSTWGVFRHTTDSPDCIILLDAQKDRWDFPELKRVAYEESQYWEPDRGHDKSTRMHSVAPIFESGLVYAPERKFAEEMIEECASFPFGKNDDLCDTMTQALMRFREGGLVSLGDDYEDREKAPVKRVYY